MAAIAFDTLAYVRRIVAAGVPREQAEAQADAMQEAFVHNVDALVTRDYLDTRFTECETRVEAHMDRRFTEVDQRFTATETNVGQRFTAMEASMDQRCTAMEASVDRRCTAMEVSVDKRFDSLELRFERIDSKFSRIYLMFGLTMIAATIPILQNFFGR